MKNINTVIAFSLAFVLVMPVYAAGKQSKKSSKKITEEKFLCGEEKKEPIAYNEKSVRMYMDASTFNFMLDNMPLCGKLAKELAITEFKVSYQKPNSVFEESGFKISVSQQKRLKGRNHHQILFDYLIGANSMLPLNVKGIGNANISFKSGKGNSIIANFNISLCPGTSTFDSLSYKSPSVIKAVFTAKMEKVLRQAENLSDYIKNDAGYLIELMDESDEIFTRSEINMFKKFLKGAA